MATIRSASLAIIASLLAVSLQAQQDTGRIHASRTAPLLTGDRSVTDLGAGVTVLDVDSLLHEFPVRTFTELLTGRVPGVEVLASSGTLGTGLRILIRGPSTFTATSAPQIYMDGVRVDDEPATLTVSVGGQTTSRVDDINVADIATIAILPGPAATAAYGTDAANGVLLITTKRGAAGASRLRVFSSQGLVAQPLAFPANFRAVDSSGAACTAAGVASGACRLLESNVLVSPASSPFRDGYLRQYGLSASGGGEATRYYLAGSWDGSGGVYGLPGAEQARLAASGGLHSDVLNPNYLRRINVRGNGQLTLAPNADVGIAVGYLSSDLRLPINDNNVTGILSNGLLGHADTTVQQGWNAFLPGEIFQVRTTQGVERLTASIAGTWRPVSFLTARAVAGLDLTAQDDKQLQRSREGPTFGGSSFGFVTQNALRRHRYTLTVTTAATFRLSSGVAARTTAGVQYFKDRGDLSFVNAALVAPGDTAVNGGQVLSTVRSSLVNTMTGVMLEQQVTWQDRFFLTGGLRRDATKRFGVSAPAALYPQLGAAWHVPTGAGGPLRSLRLRAAYGVAGRQAPFTLKAERTREIDGGVDADLWQGRVAVGATAYSRRTSGVASPIALPPSVGGGFVFPDSGEVSNKGLELTLSAGVVRSRDVTWDVAVSAWGNRNRVLRVGATPIVVTGGAGVLQVVDAGLPLGSYTGFPIVGYVDTNGDGVVSPGEVQVGSAIRFLGAPFPTQGGALSTAVTLGRRVRAAALLEYRGGNSLLNSTEMLRCLSGMCRAVNDPGAPLGDQVAAAAGAAGSSAGWVENGRFVKLRDVSLAFNAPARWAARVGAAEMTFTLSGRNLATWTSYRGLDPEVNTHGTEGVAFEDLFTQPLPRYWTARLDLSF